MKVLVKDKNGFSAARMELSGHSVCLSEMFNGVLVTTTDPNVFGICQRDNGLEITAPDGTVVGVKVGHLGKTVIERNGKVVVI